MTIIRVAERNKFTTLDRRVFNDARLTWRARGLLHWILDKPDNWKFDRNTLVAEAEGNRDADGMHVVRGVLQELVQFGYIVRVRRRKRDGTFCTETLIYEVPPSNPPPLAEDQPPANRHRHRVADLPPGGSSGRSEDQPPETLTEERRLTPPLPPAGRGDVATQPTTENPERRRDGSNQRARGTNPRGRKAVTTPPMFPVDDTPPADPAITRAGIARLRQAHRGKAREDGPQ